MDAIRTTLLKLPETLDRRLTEFAHRRNTTKSAVLRMALKAFLAQRPKSVTELAGDLVGKCEGPEDLSTNPHRMFGYGESASSRRHGRQAIPVVMP